MHPLEDPSCRRLYPRGPENRGLAVDADGAIFGPDCFLVRRTAGGYRCLGRDEAGTIQQFLIGNGGDPDRLFETCRAIARSLADGQIALAQIRALHLPIRPLDERRLAQLAVVAPLIKANFNPDELRDWHGRWTAEDGAQGQSPEPASGDIQAHLTDAGYTLSTETWSAVRGLYRAFMDSGGDIAAMRAYLADRGLRLDELPEVVKSMFDPPQPIERLQTTKPPRGFDTELQLRQYLGPARPGYEWHHLIEQNGQYRPDLTSPQGIRTWIQNTANMVQVPVIKHYCISGLMSRKYQDVRLRDFVRAHDPQAQRRIGIGLLRLCKVIP